MERRIAQGRTDDVTRYSEAAKTCANRAAALTQRLLAFSRRQSLDTRRINVTGLVRSLEELLRRSIGERIDLDCLMPADLWAARCDANQLESAILNLAINARDAMPKGGKLQIKAANVTVTDEPHSKEGISSGQYVTLAVLDSGAGMNADTVSRAFEPFFTTKPLGQGTGLGLSMIYGFMRQSGGFVTLESMEGQGTSVVLFLPRDISDKADGEMDLQAPPSSGQDHGGTVLVVEDEQAVRELVVDILEEQGYLVMQAIDGPSGLDALKFDGKVDLLVTDVGLPGLNGRQLADAARLARPELKILFMTGYAHNAAGGNDMLQAGMELITKPFSVENFLDQIRSIMRL